MLVCYSRPMQLDILPLAITTMLGPQILASIIFITSKKNALKVSMSYVAGIVFAAATFIAAVFIVARLLGIHADAAGHAAKKVTAVEVILIGLLIFASMRSYLGRATAKPPKWLAKLENTGPGGAFKLGLLLIYFMPTDIIVMVTVGLHLASHGSVPADILAALPFLAVVVLIAAAPLLAFIIFHRRAKVAMPKVRDWMQANSWLVNIVIYLFFIYLILS
jgi:hypothetical protein